MDYEFAIVKKTFKDENGKLHDYAACELTIGGKTISLFPRTEQKELLKYILEAQGFFD